MRVGNFEAGTIDEEAGDGPERRQRPVPRQAGDDNKVEGIVIATSQLELSRGNAEQHKADEQRRGNSDQWKFRSKIDTMMQVLGQRNKEKQCWGQQHTSGKKSPSHIHCTALRGGGRADTLAGKVGRQDERDANAVEWQKQARKEARQHIALWTGYHDCSNFYCESINPCAT